MMSLRFRPLRPRDLLLPAAVIGPALLAAMAGPATAQSAQPNPQMMQTVQKACGADIRKLCPDVQPGGGRILQCMKAKESELSGGCKTALLTAKEQQGK